MFDSLWMVYSLSIFQHVVFGICRLIDFMVPDVPEALEIKIKRERYLAKQALADTDTIMKVCNL
jgi:anoctamin-7